MIRIQYVILCLVVSVGVVVSVGCDQTCCATEWLGYNGYCYRYFGYHKTWEEARAYCLSIGADLASIHSQVEENLLHGLTNGEHTWTGLNDITTEGSWEWSDGTPIIFKNWGAEQPDDSGGGQDCGYVGWSDADAWDDGGCGYRIGFICKK